MKAQQNINHLRLISRMSTHGQATTRCCIVIQISHLSLPIIKSPGTDIAALDHLLSNRLVSGLDKKVTVTLVLDLYEQVFKLEYLDDQYRDKWIFSI